jgi:hypothetical protein
LSDLPEGENTGLKFTSLKKFQILNGFPKWKFQLFPESLCRILSIEAECATNLVFLWMLRSNKVETGVARLHVYFRTQKCNLGKFWIA